MAKPKHKNNTYDRFFYVEEEDIQEVFESLELSDKIKENSNEDTNVWNTLRTSNYHNL